MKLGLALAAAVLGCVPFAWAQAASERADIAITGAVVRKCILAAPQINLGSATNVGSVSGSTIHIVDLSGDDMSTRATNFSAQLSAICNFSHQIVISSDRGGLWRSPVGAVSPGFALGVPYSATVSWNGVQATLRATAASESTQQQTLSAAYPASGDIAITFHIDQAATNAGSGTPLVSGTYTDTIRITMGPQ